MPVEERRLTALCRRLACEYEELLALLQRGYTLRQAEQLLAAPRQATRQGAIKNVEKGNHREHRGNKDQK